jgi:hypothetical protein
MSLANQKGIEKMRRIWLVVILLLGVGCQNIRGPFQAKSPIRVDDPRVPITEQERRARERLALPDESAKVAPHSGAAYPGLSATR